MQNPQCKLCPYCDSVQSLDSRYCSQCANELDGSTYASRVSKYKNTIIITVLGATCAALLLIVFAIFISKPVQQLPTATSNANLNQQMESSHPIANIAVADIPVNAALKTKPKKSVTPVPSPSVEPADEDMTGDMPDNPGYEYKANEAKPKQSPSDKPIDGDRVVGLREYITGPRGGCYYINGSGNKTYVAHSFCGRADEPSYSTPVPTYSAPAASSTSSSGASAKCRDGSLSYSASRRGTCSHHGGVAEWY